MQNLVAGFIVTIALWQAHQAGATSMIENLSSKGKIFAVVKSVLSIVLSIFALFIVQH
jgi:hypothetical protein